MDSKTSYLEKNMNNSATKRFIWSLQIAGSDLDMHEDTCTIKENNKCTCSDEYISKMLEDWAKDDEELRKELTMDEEEINQ